MAHIYFYDATELDEEQLSDSLKHTDHHWEFIPEVISVENCNPEAEVISVFISSNITREIIEHMPNLKLIALRSTGYNNVDFTAADEAGVTVVNVPVYGNETVAEYVFSLLLALTRKIPQVINAEHTRVPADQLTGQDLHGKTLGVIGTGNIGQKSLKIADGFSMNCLAYDVYPKEELQDELNFKYVELDELIKNSDIITLHIPYLPSTHHIMNEERMSAMKPGAILVNTARGTLVDTKALVELLDSGHLGGAAIDVVEGEQLLHHNSEMALLRDDVSARGVLVHSLEIEILKGMPNVIISPHNAYNTAEAISRINQTTTDNIIKFWQGDMPNKVTPPPKPRGKLLLTRHGESRWNATGQWTGVTDISLDDKGFKEATKLGQALLKTELKVDIGYYTPLIRTRETLEGMFNAAQMFDVPIEETNAMIERDYGIYTGQNKWEVKEQIGEEKFMELRRGWNVPIENGESLAQVYERVVPFYNDVILPKLLRGDNVLIAAHGNSNRALMKYIESISDEDIGKLEMIFGQIMVYDVKEDGLADSKYIISIDTAPQDS